MANTDAPFGLRPARSAHGQSYNGRINKYYVDSGYGTALFVGDPVKLSGSADADGVPGVQQGAAGDALCGVIVGIEPDYGGDLGRLYLPASTGGYVYVMDDPAAEFEIQEDSDGGALAATNVGQNANIIVGSGNTSTGRSGVELDSSTAATTATLPLQILGLSKRVDNEIGDNANWRVKINKHQFANARTGV